MEWKTLKLKEVIYKPVSGEWGKEILGKEDENAVKVLRTANFTNKGIINYENVVIRNITPEKVDQKKLLFGDVLVEKSGGTDKYPVGRVVFYDKMDEIYLSNNFTTVFRAREKIMDNKFLFYYLMFNYNRGGMTKYYNQTTGIQNLRLNNLVKELGMPVPPIEMQKQIVEVLDEAQNLKDNRKEQIKLLDDLIESIFYDMFGDPVINDMGWEVKKLKEESICIVPARDKPKSFTGEIPWITINDLEQTGYTMNSKEELGLTLKEITQVNRKVVPIGCVLMSCVGNLGITSINGVELVINQQIHAFQCSDNLNNKYLKHYIPKRMDYLDRAANSTTVKYINKTKCENIPLLFPPISLQNEFAEKVQTIEEQKELMADSLKLMEDNYNGLMQRVFKGDLF